MEIIKYNQIITKIFQRCSKRIKERLDFLNSKIENIETESHKHDSLTPLIKKIANDKITNSSICPDDEKLISRILNCKLTKNNRYLITPKAMKNELDIGDGKIIELGLINILKFKDEIELLWGTSEEINEYLKEIYDDIIFSLIDNKKYDNFSLDMILTDYVDFAFYSAYHTFDKINNSATIPLIYYGMTYDEIDNKYFSTLFESAEILYKKCENDFRDIFIKFINDTNTFYKIDIKFENVFMKNMFIPMLLNKYKPDVNSLGLRVRTLVINDFKYIPELITNGENTPNYENKKSLFNATFEYINKLSDIQKNKSLL